MRSIRGINSWLHVVILAVLCAVGASVAHVAADAAPASSAAVAGITVAPATLTIALQQGEAQQSARFTITNHYPAAITLHFAPAPSSANRKTALDVSHQLSVQDADLTIGAGQSLTQVVTLNDNNQLAPGSQIANIMISQRALASGQVGVAASVSIPVVAVKEAGARTSLTLGSLDVSHFAWVLPRSIHTVIRNTGNMIAIPHGYITVQAPNGRIVESGAVNIASAAVSPDATIDLTTPLLQVHHLVWPGMYRVSLQYGLGHGQPATAVSMRMFYLTWWHAIILLAVAAGIYYALRSMLRTLKQNVHIPASVKIAHVKKAHLAGRGAP